MSINSKNGENPKISVLMPVYKTPESYLKEAIESILNQTFTDFEFLILDDCPEQSVERIVKFYRDERIKYYKNEKNLGISASRNRLMDLAKGEYLAVMDHDDIALPERLAKEIAFLEAHSDVGVVGTWYERFPNKKVKKKYVINSQIERDLMSNCSILHPSAMIRKSVLLENNIRYEAEFSPAEDYMLWVRLIGKTKFANIPKVLLKYRDYAGNTSKIQADCGSGNWNSFAGLERIRECLISKTVEHWWEYVFSVKSSYRRIIVRVLGVKFTFDKEMRGD